MYWFYISVVISQRYEYSKSDKRFKNCLKCAKTAYQFKQKVLDTRNDTFDAGKSVKQILFSC